MCVGGGRVTCTHAHTRHLTLVVGVSVYRMTKYEQYVTILTNIRYHTVYNIIKYNHRQRCSGNFCLPTSVSRPGNNGPTPLCHVSVSLCHYAMSAWPYATMSCQRGPTPLYAMSAWPYATMPCQRGPMPLCHVSVALRHYAMSAWQQ